MLVNNSTKQGKQTKLQQPKFIQIKIILVSCLDVWFHNDILTCTETVIQFMQLAGTASTNVSLLAVSLVADILFWIIALVL